MMNLEGLLKALLKNGLKISSKKCSLFRTNLHYMGNEIFIQNKKGLHQTSKKQIRSNSKIAAPPLQQKDVEASQRWSIFKHILPRAPEIIKTHL